MPECVQCGDEWPREKMLSLDLFKDAARALDDKPPVENPDVVCLRCASVAMKGGPENMTEQERKEHRVVLDGD